MSSSGSRKENKLKTYRRESAPSNRDILQLLIYPQDRTATSYRPNNTMFTRHPKKKPLKENQPHVPREFLGRLRGSGTNLPDRKAYLTDAFLKLMNILEKVVT